MQFAKNLLRRSVENDAMLNAEIEGNTPNWDQDRIAMLDKVLIKMALGEFSSVFINTYKGDDQ